MYIKDLKFSLWADFIERDYLDKEFKNLVNDGIINGATSNPAIFKNAILNSPAYKQQLENLSSLGAKEKYEAVAIYDIQKAADILKPLFDKQDDGYVSIEVDPFLCDDAEATIAEGKRLFKTIDRENVMIKVPATTAGYQAMQALVASGIPVNATLIFSKEQALSCAQAFEKGLQSSSKDVDTVISIFVSRIDRALDSELAKHSIETALSGIYNSADIYEAIEQKKVPGCRALFASTGVKKENVNCETKEGFQGYNSLAAHYYIENLLAYNSVNTAPVDTITSFHSNGKKEQALPIAQTIIQEHFSKIKNAGIDFDKVLQKQIDDGLQAFKDAFKDILEAL